MLLVRFYPAQSFIDPAELDLIRGVLPDPVTERTDRALSGLLVSLRHLWSTRLRLRPALWRSSLAAPPRQHDRATLAVSVCEALQ